MSFQKAIMGVGIEVNGYFVFYRCFKFLVKVADELGDPAIVFVVILSITNEDVVFKTGN